MLTKTTPPYISFLCFQMFEYAAVVKLLLEVIGKSGQEEFIQRIGVYLINSMACQVDGAEKLMVGDLGAIHVSSSSRHCEDID